MNARLVTAVLAMGAVGGVLLGLVAGVWGATPAGNAALVVPFGGGPALLAAGWAVLALAWRRGERRTRRLVAGGVLSGLVGLALALFAVFAPAVQMATAAGG